MTLAHSLITHCQNLFQIVLAAVSQDEPVDGSINQRNAKGDQVKWFDLAADRAVSYYLQTQFPYSVTLLSEEGDPRQFGPGEPQFKLVLDPVDGSENFLRQLPPSALALAFIPATEPLTIEAIQVAFVGNLVTNEQWWAIKNEGCFLNGQIVRPRAAQRLDDILISCDLNHYIIESPVNAILAQAQGVRSLGAATLALTNVAAGIFGLHIDPRGTLTPENFLAPARLILEAGGVITDLEGRPLPAIHSLTDRFSILAATTPTLHQQAVEQLRAQRNRQG